MYSDIKAQLARILKSSAEGGGASGMGLQSACRVITIYAKGSSYAETGSVCTPRKRSGWQCFVNHRTYTGLRLPSFLFLNNGSTII